MSEFRENQPRHCVLVTPADTDAVNTDTSKRVYVGLRVTNETAGWLSLKLRNGFGNPNGTVPVDVVLRVGPGATDYIPGQFIRVWLTGTDAALTVHGYCDLLN